LAKLANYDAKQLSEYEQSYNDYLGFKASMDFQYTQGKKEGREEGREEGEKIGMEKGIEKKAKITAVKLIKKGMTNEEIAEITDLAIAEIELIRKELKINDK